MTTTKKLAANKLVQNFEVLKPKKSALTLSINRKRPEKQNHAKNAILVYLKESHIIDDILDFNAKHFNDSPNYSITKENFRKLGNA